MTIKLTGFLLPALFCLAACSAANEASQEAAYYGDDADEDFDASFLEDLPPAERAEIEAMLREDGILPPQNATGGPTAYQGGAQPVSFSSGGQAPAQSFSSPRNAAPGAQPVALPSGAHRVKRVEIMDPSGFEKPLVAYTIMLPVDWRSQGGVVWGQNMACGASGYDMNFAAMSPDGRTGVQLIPSANWTWNNFSGPQNNCIFAPIQSAQQYLEFFVSQARPGARVIDFRPRADLAEPLKQMNSVMPMAGGEQRSWVDAGEVLIGYNANGVDTRETVAAVVYVNHARMEGGVGMGQMEFLSGAAMSAWSMRAPNGQLDFTFSELLRKSIVAAPEWSQRIARHNAKISQTNLKGARDRSAIIAKTNSDILDIQMETWRSGNESSDRIQRESTEAIMGVETYNDPYYGGTVQLDHTYDNAWQLNDGSYVLTNDAMFEPYRDLGVDGQRLEAAQ